MTKYVYKLIHGCWMDEIDAELKEREVKCEISDFPTGSRLYRIPISEVDKLPKDKDGYYFPKGFSLTEDKELELMTKWREYFQSLGYQSSEISHLSYNEYEEKYYPGN